MSDSNDFASLPLQPALLEVLARLEYSRMTPVQAAALPRVLAGDDVLARARTGSGKTAAFGLGLLSALDTAKFLMQCLVLCPTRELAEQVGGEIRRLGSGIPNVKLITACGGVAMAPQRNSLRHGVHIVVGTPGRVLAHLNSGALDLKHLRTLVLDEADRMLDMGFADEIEQIIKHVPTRRQTLLFSATYPPSIASISARVQRDPVRVDVTDSEPPADIEHLWYHVARDTRADALKYALRAHGGACNLVFCNTRLDCADVERALSRSGIVTLALHGDLDQARRNEVLVRFANGSASVLVATDVAARGLDVSDLDAVFNYELPPKPEVYVHRAGRTARAGRSGVAVSLVTSEELGRLRDIEAKFPELTIGAREVDAPLSRRALPDPAMTTIQISGGRRSKLRKGDVLGALTAAGGVAGNDVGAIDLLDECCYVAVRPSAAAVALRQLRERPIKGRQYRARLRT